MNIKELQRAVEVCLLSKVVPFIQGSPGIGKSDLVKAIAKKYKLKLIDIRLSQCDPTDLNGLPKLDGDVATYLPFDTFPTENTELPENTDGWLIFLDEINSAPRSIQAAAYKLILDRMVGNHKLHKKVAIVCAGNKDTDNAVVNPLSTALRSRFVTLPLEVNVDNWIEWAINNDIDYRIIAYIKWKSIGALYDFNPENTNDAYACPRSWYMLNKILKTLGNEDIKNYMSLVTGTVGKQGVQFCTYAEYCKKLPKIEEIYDGSIIGKMKTKTYSIEESFMLTSFVFAHVKDITPDTVGNVLDFLDLFSKEFVAPFFAIVVRNNPSLISVPAVSKKVGEFATWLSN